MLRRCFRPAQAFAVQPSRRQARPSALARNLAFELSKDREQTGHGARGWRRNGQARLISKQYAVTGDLFRCGGAQFPYCP
jgi:hypothetical protein